MWDWLHRTGYPEDHYDETGLTTEEVLAQIKEKKSIFIEYDIIVLQNPNPSFNIWEFQEQFGSEEKT